MQANLLLLGGIVFGLVVTATGDQGTIRVLPFGKYLLLCGFIVMPKCNGGPTLLHKYRLFFQVSPTATFSSAKRISSLVFTLQKSFSFHHESRFVNSSQLNVMCH